MPVDTPEIEWSEWHIWSEREKIKNCNWPGIYRIAIGDRADLHKLGGWARVRYIGMSLVAADPERPLKRSGLAARWKQLDRAMRVGKGHSGGNRIWQEYERPKGGLKDNVLPGKPTRNTVFVSAMVYAPRMDAEIPQFGDSPRQLREDGVVLHLEYEALAQYAEARPRNRRPKFNRK